MLIAEGLVPRPEILATWRPGIGKAGLSGAFPDGGGLMLVASGLVKRYGTRPALDGFDLTVAPGEIVGLIGPNGAGKTTFVEIVSGLVRPDAGTVLVGGRDALRSGRAVRRLAGVAPQERKSTDWKTTETPAAAALRKDQARKRRSGALLERWVTSGP